MSDLVPALAGAPRRLLLHCIGSPVAGHERYAERALVLARGDDVVCVPRAIEPEYLGFLSTLGLGPAAANVVAVPAGGQIVSSLAARLLVTGGLVELVARRLGATPVTIHPYAGTAEVFALARALELVSCRPVRVQAPPPELMELVDQKPLMRARAVELGIPVGEGEVAQLASEFGRRRRDLEPLRLAIGRQLRRTGRVIVRGAAGSGGSSTFLVGPGGEDTDDVLRRVALKTDNRTYLVEVLVDATVCSTVHLLIHPGGAVEPVGTSDRRLGRGLTPTGSRSPSAARTADAMQLWAGAFGGWLRDAGYAGLVGIDFVEYRDPATGEPRSFFAGVDPRANEGTYAMALQQGVAAPAFVSGTVATRAASFARLREVLGGLLYDPDRGHGVVPYATGCLEQGRCPIVALGGDRLHASELLGKAQAAVDIPAARLVS